MVCRAPCYFMTPTFFSFFSPPTPTFLLCSSFSGVYLPWKPALPRLLFVKGMLSHQWEFSGPQSVLIEQVPPGSTENYGSGPCLSRAGVKVRQSLTRTPGTESEYISVTSHAVRAQCILRGKRASSTLTAAMDTILEELLAVLGAVGCAGQWRRGRG